MGTTLAEHLRALPDDGLGALIELRPDLVVPVPGDLSALAVRVQSRLSVTRALDGLDRFTLEILDALRLTRTLDEVSSVDAVLALTAASTPAPDTDTVRAAIDRLRAHVLIHGPDDALRIVSIVNEVCAPYPAGLGRPAVELDDGVADLVADPARLRRTLLTAPPAARAVLDRLAAGPPIGTIKTPGESPVGWLVDHHLLVPVADGAVELPREVALLLRRDAGPLGALHPWPPKLATTQRESAAADSAGAGQAMEAVRQTEALLEALGAEPATTLRSGGLGIRELRRLARAAGLDEPAAVLALEVAHAAGLLGTADATDRGLVARGGADGQFLPTVAYDSWRTMPIAHRWGVLARGWLDMTREARLVGARDDRDRPINALAPEAERIGAPATRRAVLRVLADLPPGATADAADLLDQLAWRAPRRARGRDASTQAVLVEAAALGVTGLGVITSYGRLLFAARAADEDPLGVQGDDERADPLASALDSLLPPPVDHVLVQADLTVVVPGPPEPLLAAELSVAAEHESAGGATVYRVTPDSVRRALDAGYTAADLHALFARRSRTPVPQGLTYLVDDVARRHGGLRVGTVGAYVRSDDEALLAELLVDRALAAMSLRRLAPTVLATPYGSGRLLSALREAGYAPVPEDASGAAVLTRPKSRRAPIRSPGQPRLEPRLTPPRVLGIVEQMRRGDAAARAARRAPVRVRAANGHPVDGLTTVQAHTQALAVLAQALREKARVWVGYVDAHGSTAQRLVRPVSIGAGYLRAEDDRTETLHTFALHRITAAELDV